MLMVLRTMLLYVHLPLTLWGWLTLVAFTVGGFRIGRKPFICSQKWFDNHQERYNAESIGAAAAIVLWFWLHGCCLISDLQDNYWLYKDTEDWDGSSEKGYHKALASFGRSYAKLVVEQYNTLPWQVKLAEKIMFIVAVTLLAVLFLGYRRLCKTNKENLAAWNADTFESRFSTVALENSVEWAASYENNYLGFKLVGHDAEGSADPWYMAFEDINLYQARCNGRLNGVPGGGLEASRFDSDAIASGRAGEEALARIIVGSDLKVVSFWSLYGKDSEGNPTDADVDCVLVGVNKSGKVHVWFVDAKNYKGGSDTKYVNVGHDENGHNVITRISKFKHALISGKDGKPDLVTSENMANQFNNWRHMPGLLRANCKSYICMVPTGENGLPDVENLVWTGGIKCVTPKQLVEEIQACDLDDPSKIPAKVTELFYDSLKK